jgi:glycosyltransferase involved in cell wall biosynthesis
VTYWTGTWDPTKEAISKEIDALRDARAPVISFSPGQQTRLIVRERVLKLSGGYWPVLRAVASAVESWGDLTHIFGGQSSWHLVRALGRRPIILTAVVARSGVERLPHTHFERVVVEAERGITEWLESGVPQERIVLIRPGVDLEGFRAVSPTVPPTKRLRLLFASTPSDPAEFDARGIPLLVALARLRGDLEITVPWRNWGDVNAARRALEALRPPANFMVIHENVDMRLHYANAHATIVCFGRSVGKACPNFVLEGLASGRPCISTPEVGISDLIGRVGAGVVASRDVTSLSQAADRLLETWPTLAHRAQQLAEEEFDLRQFRSNYERLYKDVLSSKGKSPRHSQ